MRCYRVEICVLDFIWLSLAPSASLAIPQVIVPGHSIGHVRLGEDFDAVTRRLGQPQWGDGAAGRSWNAWFPAGKSNSELDVYTSRYALYPDGRPDLGNRLLVRQVRVTSPRFHTRSGLGVGASLGQIHRQFPRAARVSYRNGTGRSETLLYDDRQAGIAFQMRRAGEMAARCAAIVIHPRNKAALDEMYPIHPDVLWYNRSTL